MVKEKYILNIKETTINIVNSKIESIRLKNDTKTSLRIYKDGYIGVAGAIGVYDEDELEKEAMEALNYRIEYPCMPSSNRKEKLSNKKEFLKDEALAGEIEEFLRELASMHPDFIFSNKVMLQEINARIYNDVNLDLEYEDKAFIAAILYKEKASSNIIDGYFDFQTRNYNKQDMLEEAHMILSAYQNKIELPAEGKYPVIISASDIPAGKLIADLNGQLFAAGGSLLSNKLNEQVFNSDFTFYQTLNPEDLFNIPFFDAEGTVNADYRHALIEKGIIKSAYTDKKTSVKFNLLHTGSAQAAYDGVPTLQFTGFKIKESDKTIKELLKGDNGIYVMIADGGDFTPEGDYGTPVQLAMLFDGEKLIGRLPEFQISSNIFEMYGSSFRGVGRNSILPFSKKKFAIADFNVSKG